MADNKLNFEQNLSELENIVKKLEDSDCTLEESIELFKKGIELSKNCKTALNNAEKVIVELTELENEVENPNE